MGADHTLVVLSEESTAHLIACRRQYNAYLRALRAREWGVARAELDLLGVAVARARAYLGSHKLARLPRPAGYRLPREVPDNGHLAAYLGALEARRWAVARDELDLLGHALYCTHEYLKAVNRQRWPHLANQPPAHECCA